MKEVNFKVKQIVTAITFLAIMCFAGFGYDWAQNIGWYVILFLSIACSIAQLAPDASFKHEVKIKVNNLWMVYLVCAAIGIALHWYFVVSWWILASLALKGRYLLVNKQTDKCD